MFWMLAYIGMGEVEGRACVEQIGDDGVFDDMEVARLFIDLRLGRGLGVNERRYLGLM